ncbi:MAG: leucine-rich repeat protein [Clostridia bacterium]|nr:leucine-rich repeat protein [Clostridia bacterium]
MRLILRFVTAILVLWLFSTVALAMDSIVVSPSVKIIEEEAFSKDVSINRLILNENIEKIGWRAFADCVNLTEIYCFSNNVQIDESAFDGIQGAIVYCYPGSTIEQLAQKIGLEVRLPLLFEINCDTHLNGAVGLPITWEVNWLATIEQDDIKYKWTVMRTGDTQPIIQEESSKSVFTFTPTKAGTYMANATILAATNTASRDSDPVDVAASVYFGIYEQDGKTSTHDPLEWTVLDVTDGEALLITKKIIRNDSYFNPEWIKYKYTYWAESCVGSSSSINWWGVIAKDSMKITGITPDHVPLENHTFGKEEDIFYVHSRYWLNEIFYESAFDENEKNRIVTVYNINEDNPEYGTDSGPDSVDKVFFLSYSEMIKYMPTAASRKVTMTTMAARESKDNIGKYWWLRTSGAKRWFAMHIQGSDGNISYFGSDVGHDNVGYRPCIRIRVGG